METSNVTSVISSTPHYMEKILNHPLPPVIIVHFTRFNRTRVKDENPVEFSMKHKFDDSDESWYELIGIVSHAGSIYSGHYTAYAKNSYNQKWYYFNDSSTHPIDNPVNEPSIARNAYMLVYTKNNAARFLLINFTILISEMF